MPQTIAATVFVPRIPVNLPEHTEVKLLLPKLTTKRNQLTKAEMSFLALDPEWGVKPTQFIL